MTEQPVSPYDLMTTAPEIKREAIREAIRVFNEMLRYNTHDLIGKGWTVVFSTEYYSPWSMFHEDIVSAYRAKGWVIERIEDYQSDLPSIREGVSTPYRCPRYVFKLPGKILNGNGAPPSESAV